MIVYTNAPEAYDYSYMVEIHREDVRNSTWRTLEVHDEWRFENFQLPRYHSGLYSVIRDFDQYEEMKTW